MPELFSSKYMLGKVVANGVLALAVVVAVWVVGRELWGIGGGERGRGREIQETVPVSQAALARQEWQVGTARLSPAGDVYEVAILDKNSREICKIKLDAFTGQPLAKGEGKPEKEAQGAGSRQTGAIMDSQAAAKRVSELLPNLGVGPGVRKGNKPFYEVPLRYGGFQLATLKMDIATGRVLVAGEKPAQAGKREKEQAERRGSEKLKVMPKRWVVPLGWLAVIVVIISSLYYSWKRSLFGPIRAAGGEARAKAAAALRRTLWWHEVLGLVAAAVAFGHIVNSLPKLRLSVSWLALGMMLTVGLSGAFGELLARNDTVRAHWRRFHRPFTLLFFLVLLVHLLLKAELFGD